MLHADYVATGLFSFCAPENISHRSLEKIKGYVDEGMQRLDIWPGEMDRIKHYLEVICDKAVNNRIHTAI